MLGKLKSASSCVFVWTTILFLASVSLRAFLADFDKLVSVYPDELLYIEAYRSMFSGNGFTFRGVDSSFDKILYSVFLLPSMVFSETDTQLRAISFLNVIYMSSAVFPTVLLARRAGLEVWSSLVCAVLVLALPDMCLTMTFMSENIYFPLSLWLVYWIWATFSGPVGKQVVRSAFLAVACFLAYLCKEVGLCFVLVYGALLVLRIVKNPGRRECDVRSLIVFVALFAILFFWFKVFIYQQESHYTLVPPQSLIESVGFFVYSFVVNCEYLFVGIFVIPLLVCIWMYSDMTEKDKSLFLICILWGFITVFVITYTISIREDVALGAIRQHTRYYSALVVPIFVLFLKYALKKVSFFEKPIYSRIIAAVVAFLFILGTVLLSPVFYGSLVDNLNLRYFNWIIEKIGQYTALDPIVAIRLISSVVVALLFLCIVLTRYKRFAVGLFLVLVLTACLIGNVVCVRLFEESYSISDHEKNEVMDIGRYLSEEHANVLVVLDSNPTYSRYNRKLDTFLEAGSEYQVYTDTLYDLVEDDGAIDLLNETLATRSFNLANLIYYKGVEEIDYVLVNINQGITVASSSGALVESFTYGDCRLYELGDTSKIDIEISLPENAFSMRIG